jgi:Tfp pilus assembly protein PilF
MQHKAQIDKSPPLADTIAKRFWYFMPFALIPIVHLVGTLAGSYAFWGADYWALIDRTASVVILLVSTVLVLPPLVEMVGRAFSALVTSLANGIRRIPVFVQASVLVVVSGVVFYIFRSRTMVHGDGYAVFDFLTTAPNAAIGGQYLLQYTSVRALQSALPILQNVFGIDAHQAFGLANVIGGSVGLLAIAAICRLLVDRLTDRLFLFLATVGHIETYTWPLSLSLWVMYAALFYLRHRRGLWMLILSALLALLAHLITVPVVFGSLLAVALVKKRLLKSISVRLLGVFVVILISVAAIVLELIRLPQLFGLSHIFVPVFPQPFNAYWFASPAHLLDLVNLFFLIAPLGTLLFVFQIINRGQRPSLHRNIDLTLMLCALIPLSAVLWIDPELGMVRDWDLLAIFGMPLSLWAGWRFLHYPLARKYAGAFAFAALVVATVHIVPDVYEKTHPEKALERMNARLWDSPHYQTSYYAAERCMSWGTLMNKAEKRNNVAGRFFGRMLEARPGSAEVWYDMGITYRDRKMPDSALAAFRRSYSINSTEPRVLRQLAMAEARKNILDSAEVHISLAINREPRNADNYAILGSVLYKRGKFKDALDALRQSLALKPNNFNQIANLGKLHYQLRQFDSAAVYLYRGIMIDPSRQDLYDPLIISLLAANRGTDAQRVLSAYQRMNPEAASLDEYKKAASKRMTGQK